MVKFRWNKDTLEESMATVIEFDNMWDLFFTLWEDNGECYVKDIKIQYCGKDKSINQKLFLVTIKDLPVGFIFE